jgi:hypothetical protein
VPPAQYPSREVTTTVHHEHLRAETVADHLEGLLGPGEAAEAERHLALCPECSALRGDLGRLRAALASDSTVPMPASVAARIDLALAEEAEERAAAGLSAGGRSPSGQDQTATQLVRPPAGSGPRRRRWVPALGGALATIAIVIGALAVLPRFTSSHNENAQGATAREGAATSQSEAGGGQADGLSPGPNASANGYGSAPGGQSAGADGVVRSGRAYTAYTLSAGVRELLAERDTARVPAAAQQEGGSAPSSGPLANSGDPLVRLSSQSALAACIQGLVKSDVVPIVVDLATYGGEPAAIIVLPDPADSTSANVYVVGPNCGPGVSTPIATTTVRRPVTAAPSPNAPSGTQSAPATPSGP